MKNIFLILPALILGASCSEVEETAAGADVTDSGSSYTGNILAQWEPLKEDDGTKTYVEENKVGWAEGDVLGVWPLSTSPEESTVQGRFVINNITQSYTVKGATFTTDGFVMICDGKYSYSSYYPYNADDTYDCARISYPKVFTLKQRKICNDDAFTVGRYMYMYAPAVQPDNPNKAVFNFKHLSTIAKFVFSFPLEDTLRIPNRLDVTSEGELFTLSAHYNPSAVSDSLPVFQRDSVTNLLSVYYTAPTWIKRAGTSDSTDPIYFTLPMFPAELAGTQLFLKVTCADGVRYQGTYQCTKDQKPGFIYNYTSSDFHKVSIESADNQEVDLGLSVNWASMNLGAESREDIGYHVAWGHLVSDVQPPSTNYWNYYKYGSYRWKGRDEDKQANVFADPAYAPDYGLKKYNGTDSLMVLEPEDDAAVQLWGNGWRMPTESEMRELNDTTKTKSYLTTVNGVKGYWFYTTDEANGIFMPLDRYHASTVALRTVGNEGDDYPDSKGSAWSYILSESGKSLTGHYERTYMNCIRAVKDKPKP